MLYCIIYYYIALYYIVLGGTKSRRLPDGVGTKRGLGQTGVGSPSWGR